MVTESDIGAFFRLTQGKKKPSVMPEARLCTPKTTSKFRIKAKTQLYQSHLVPNATKPLIHFHMGLAIWVLKLTHPNTTAQGKAFRCQVQNLEPPEKWKMPYCILLCPGLLWELQGLQDKLSRPKSFWM